ncbi:YeeE/YedE family protein [Parvicella tangerina]|uniref:YeeE/YedE family protein n=1 Tax=Parvicella tangerina TaxID=2829795 RepID=A0A916JMT9_9FLAO|nr:YeeE/YedE family protein [Parvicella tangerina]CAG5081448.1 hypothetical protein CRYO30217_01635 [Parvicella tangerina]
MKRNIITLFIGIYFGYVLLSSEVISWYRIQEMFYFESFHMYGIIGSAIITGIASIWLIKRFQLKSAEGAKPEFKQKPLQPYANIIGGLLFGLGWALTGACPGPLYALLGNGYWIVGFIILFAILGAFLYERVKHKLPH